MNNIYFGQQPEQQPLYYYQQPRDLLGELDDLTMNLDQATLDELARNQEYSSLSSDLSRNIQSEIMNLVKGRLNLNPGICENVEKQIRIIKEAKTIAQNKQRKGMAELNDYITNYSHLTFDEYKNLKNEKKN